VATLCGMRGERRIMQLLLKIWKLMKNMKNSIRIKTLKRKAFKFTASEIG